jgi:opacity protein-like surface antigen
MYRRRLLALAVSVAALAATAAPAGAAPVRPEPQADHIIAVLIGQVQAPVASGFFKHLPGLDSETEGFMDYTDDV